MEDLKIDEAKEQKITKKVMEQYEVVRQSGATNMYDFGEVIEIAGHLELFELGEINRKEYVYILSHFSRLLKKHNVSQNC